MRRNEALQKLHGARVGRLATVRPDGTPHVIPFVFALVEDGDDLRVYWAVDDKPKKRAEIQRLANIEANPVVEFVVDGYDEDWHKLWWVRVRGHARVVETGSERRRAIDALRRKYVQYSETALGKSVIAISTAEVTGWVAS